MEIKKLIAIGCIVLGVGNFYAQTLELSNSFGETAVVKPDSITQSRVNPIIFVEGFTGIVDESFEEKSYGLSLNYQLKSHLFSYQYIRNTNDTDIYALIPIKRRNTNQHALLYGQRFVFSSISLSVSAGVSYASIQRKIHDIYSYDAPYIHGESYWGMPIELNFKLFKNKRKPFGPARLFGAKEPVGFGSSIGVKVYGSISKHNYFGAALVFGLGWHKSYKID
ncbi:hypothetical protein [Flavobacterium sp. NKUCC04_CG]|uniref:hypothetical protein n=1 Tax=Flavobacterium sp. NKUCC04_CG TaxID=2842121 RepID=UPI001C5AEED3|nr:hypothetical protein [Flavobacterium sp. NKUCC04_CG]MBW3519132.1 hypothetical protein [Flavobacterium sp. NKUCC04_CG]